MVKISVVEFFGINNIYFGILFNDEGFFLVLGSRQSFLYVVFVYDVQFLIVFIVGRIQNLLFMYNEVFFVVIEIGSF